MSKTNMTDFQRTRSKVWFPNLDDDDEDIHHSWRRQPSSSPESRRVSSVSPSNGSHKSQDSGFSDSESNSLASSKALPKADKLENTNLFTDKFPGEVLYESPVSRVPSPCEPQPQSPDHCNCFLPACELSRKFSSYDYVTAEETSPFRPTIKGREEEPCMPNRTCFIVDELPKTSVVLLATPSSVKSFDSHFDVSENVTVVENIKRDCTKNDELIIDPPTPFVDRLNGADTVSLCESDTPGIPDHTSTPKSSKNRCCTPRLYYKKELQLRKPKHLQDSFNRLIFNTKIIII